MKQPFRKYIPGHPDADANGNVSVHRLIATEMLGRPILRNEVVVWKNGDNHDNRPENLEVISKSEHVKRNGARGPRHGNWVGGRTKALNGYIWILYPDHPEAKKYHGYIPEHRLVMEKMIGRRLLPGEVVHHKDGDKTNNDPSNLELFASNGEHTHSHGKNPSERRDPTVSRRQVPCMCGCGTVIDEFDRQGRRVRFVYGHWARTVRR